MQYIILFLLTLLTYSCVERIKHEGVVVAPEAKEQITIGKTTKQDLIELMGSPSFIMSNLQNMPETWAYISVDKKWYAFLKPTTTSHSMIEIEFKGDVISKITTFTKETIPTDKITLFKLSPQNNLTNYEKPKI